MTSMDDRAPPAISFEDFQRVDLRAARVTSAPLTRGTRAPCRELTLDFGPLGQRRSIGQYALIEESELVGRLVVACVNLGTRKMGAYVSEALVLGAPHPLSPAGQHQATPLFVYGETAPGARIF